MLQPDAHPSEQVPGGSVLFLCQRLLREIRRRRHAARAVTALRPGWTVKKGPEPFQLTIRRVRETDLRFNLDSFYQQYREQPTALDRLFAARLRRLDQECDSEALFGAPLILPVLRPASFLESAGGPVGHRRMLDDMVVTYAAH